MRAPGAGLGVVGITMEEMGDSVGIEGIKGSVALEDVVVGGTPGEGTRPSACLALRGTRSSQAQRYLCLPSGRSANLEGGEIEPGL